MINPAPVTPRSTPYSSEKGGGKAPLPRTIAAPVSKPDRRRTKLRRFVAYAVLAVVAAVATYAGAQYYSFQKSVSVQHEGVSSAILNNNGNANPSDLKQAGDGRFNLVLLGVGGEGHSGPYLTDTIKVLSLDTQNKKLTITSVPRDLYVTIPGYGKSKINAAYTYGEFPQYGGHTGGGGALTKQVVGNVLGIDVSNFVMVDFSAAKELVDELGGVDVTVPTALSDPFFPCPDPSTDYCPLYVRAGTQHMSGTTALSYSRSRETTSDFDRAERQTIVLKAIKDKALTLGVLSNPVKVSNLVSILGNHVKTDLSTSDMLTFINMVKDIPNDQIKNYVLSTDPSQGLLSAVTDPTAGYIEYPVLGQGNYGDIHDWFQSNSQDPFLLKEAPTVAVMGNGIATQKQLQAVVNSLDDYGFQAELIAEGQTDDAVTTVYDDTRNKKPVSHNYLGSYFGTTVKGRAPIGSNTDFTVVYVPTRSAASVRQAATPTPLPTDTPSLGAYQTP